MMTANYHAVALALLARPALDPGQLAWVTGLAPVADLLWHIELHGVDAVTEPEMPNAQAFVSALDVLVSISSGQPASLVCEVLRHVPSQWRNLPGALIAAMAERLSLAGQEADSRIGVLEVKHFARWWVETNQPSKRSTKDWASLLAQAQQWECAPELELRQQPSAWANPLVVKLDVAGFKIEFIAETSQLVNSVHHKGVLCSLATKDAATAGVAAWFYAMPMLTADDAEVCLIALTRDSTRAKWNAPEVYAPPQHHDFLTRAACSLIAQDESAVGLAAIRRATMAVRPSVVNAMELLRGL